MEEFGPATTLFFVALVRRRGLAAVRSVCPPPPTRPRLLAGTTTRQLGSLFAPRRVAWHRVAPPNCCEMRGRHRRLDVPPRRRCPDPPGVRVCHAEQVGARGEAGLCVLTLNMANKFMAMALRPSSHTAPRTMHRRSWSSRPTSSRARPGHRPRCLPASCVPAVAQPRLPRPTSRAPT
jgi:hypothetical protein